MSNGDIRDRDTHNSINPLRRLTNNLFEGIVNSTNPKFIRPASSRPVQIPHQMPHQIPVAPRVDDPFSRPEPNYIPFQYTSYSTESQNTHFNSSTSSYDTAYYGNAASKW